MVDECYVTLFPSDRIATSSKVRHGKLGNFVPGLTTVTVSTLDEVHTWLLLLLMTMSSLPPWSSFCFCPHCLDPTILPCVNSLFMCYALRVVRYTSRF